MKGWLSLNAVVGRTIALHGIASTSILAAATKVISRHSDGQVFALARILDKRGCAVNLHAYPKHVECLRAEVTYWVARLAVRKVDRKIEDEECRFALRAQANAAARRERLPTA